MYYPKMNEVSRYREMTNVFGGYNHTLSCAEGEFYDTRNMTTLNSMPTAMMMKKRLRLIDTSLRPSSSSTTMLRSMDL